MSIICNNCGEENLEIDTSCSGCGADLYYTDALPDGTILQNRYIIERLINIGGMGAVYMGLDERLNRYCAIKEMLTSYGSLEDREYAEKRFNEEARLLSRFDHPNLPTVQDYFIEKGRYYLVMSYIEGVNLAELLELKGNPGLPEELVCEWTIQVLDVLEYLHRQNPPIVYRDIKPANIMLSKEGRVILIDFGIARAIQQEEKGKQYTSIGTDGYAAEEQYRGEVEPRSDLYSLGATIHHLLTGKIPTAFNLKPVRNYAPWVSPMLERVVMKSLEFEASQRYSDAREMKMALKNIKEEPLPGKAVIQKQIHRGQVRELDVKKKKPVSYERMKEILSEEEAAESPKRDAETPESIPEEKKPERMYTPPEEKEIRDEQKKSVSEPSAEKEKERNPSVKDKIQHYRLRQWEMTSPYRTLKLGAQEGITEETLEEALGGALAKLLKSSSNADENKSIPGFVKLASIRPEDRKSTDELGLGKRDI